MGRSPNTLVLDQTAAARRAQAAAPIAPASQPAADAKQPSQQSLTTDSSGVFNNTGSTASLSNNSEPVWFGKKKSTLPQAADDARISANRAVEKVDEKVDDLNEKTKETGVHLKDHLDFGARKAKDVIRETEQIGNDLSDQAAIKGREAQLHLKEHAKYGERKTGEMVDESKGALATAEAKQQRAAELDEARGHHNHAEFESATAHALFHMREGLEMARKVAIDAKHKIMGKPAAGIATSPEQQSS
jgi:hypothetical protein